MLIPDSRSLSIERARVQLSVVVPVYNQAENVCTSLERIKKVLNSMALTFEIIVVNDGSRDNTLEVLRQEEKLDPNIRIITYSQNKGKGHAVRTGIIRSRGETVMFTDGDLDISPNMINDYVDQLEDSDLVIASKRHPLSRYDAPASRKFLSRGFNLLVRVATGIRLRDTQSGLKAGNGEALRTIFKVMLVKRYAFDVELLTIASLLGLKIKEMPIVISLDRKFKLGDIAKMFVDVMAISYRYRIRRWYQKQLQMEERVLGR